MEEVKVEVMAEVELAVEMEVVEMAVEMEVGMEAAREAEEKEAGVRAEARQLHSPKGRIATVCGHSRTYVRSQKARPPHPRMQ
jgi:hypothetical protein